LEKVGRTRTGADGSGIRVDVCVCTYRREMLTQCLDAIAAQDVQAEIRIVVADNAEEQEAHARVEAFAADGRVPVTYIHAPARNISVARNACLDAANAPLVAFLDDDEIADPRWLAELLAEADHGRWDAILGPVDAIYPPDAPQWMRDGAFHSTRPVFVEGEIRTGYTGNVLLRRQLIVELGLRFRPEFGRTGGEDLDFFYRLRDGGGRIGFAPKAVAVEQVPVGRASLSWLLRRSFRAGQSHGTRLRDVNRRLQLPLALAKAIACTGAALVAIPTAAKRNRLLTRSALHFGVVARLAGLREIESY